MSSVVFDKKQFKKLRGNGLGTSARHGSSAKPNLSSSTPGPKTGRGGGVLDTIMSYKTEKGGWTKASLALFGVPWPPPKGWKDWLVLNGFPYNP